MNKINVFTMMCCLMPCLWAQQPTDEAHIQLQGRDYIVRNNVAYRISESGLLVEAIPTRMAVIPVDVKRFSTAFLSCNGFPGLSVVSGELPGGYLVLELDPKQLRGQVLNAFGIAQRLGQRGWIEDLELDVVMDIGKPSSEPELEASYYTPVPTYDCYPNDPKKSWHLGRINMYKAWCYTRPANYVTVAVVDSSFHLGHEEFQGMTVVKPWNFVHSNSDVSPSGNNDQNSTEFHGTRVLGLIAAISDNGMGLPGIAGTWRNSRFHCKIMPIKVSQTVIQFAMGIDYARQNGANVINISAGSSIDLTLLRSVVSAVEDQGAVLVAAAGNAGDQPIQFPAAYTTAVAVGSIQETDLYDDDSYFSPYKTLDVVAPTKVTTTNVQFINGQLVNDAIVSGWRGTSASTPQVTGVIALMLSEHPGLTPAQIRAIIHQTADYLGPLFGNGVIDAEKCIVKAQSLQ